MKSGIKYLPIVPIILIGVGLFYHFTNERITEIDFWQIDEASSSMSAEILWQKSVPCLAVSLGVPYDTFAIVADQVVIHNGCTLVNYFMGFDLSTGAKNWQVAGESPWQITAYEDSFLTIVGDSFIERRNRSGSVIWRTGRFPSRSMRRMFVQDGLIYAPTYTVDNSRIRVISPQSGQTVDTIDNILTLAVFEEYTIQRSGELVQILETNSDRILWDFPISDPSDFDDDYFFDRVDNVLIVSSLFDPIDAYDIETGEHLWKLDLYSSSLPSLSENRLFVIEHDYLNVYDPYKGSLIGRLKMIRSNSQNQNRVADASVEIKNSGNVVALVYRLDTTMELVVLEIRE